MICPHQLACCDLRPVSVAKNRHCSCCDAADTIWIAVIEEGAGVHVELVTQQHQQLSVTHALQRVMGIMQERPTDSTGLPLVCIVRTSVSPPDKHQPSLPQSLCTFSHREALQTSETHHAHVTHITRCTHRLSATSLLGWAGGIGAMRPVTLLSFSRTY